MPKKDGTEELRKGGIEMPDERLSVSDNAEASHLRIDAMRAGIEAGGAEGKLIKLSHAVDHSPSIIMITDAGGFIEYVNPRFTQITGYAPEEAIGMNASGLGEQSPEEYKEMWDTIASGGTWQGLFRNRKKSGELYWESASISPVRDGAGNITGFVKVAEDITELKRTEEEERKRRERVASQLAAVVMLSRTLPALSADLEGAIKTVTEIVAETLGVERTGVWLLSEDRKELRSIDIFEKTDGKHSSGFILRADEYPVYFASLESGRAIDANNALTDPRTCEFKDGYLVPLGIGSMLDSPVRLSGMVIGVVCIEHVGEKRVWMADEVRFAAEVADQVAQTLTEADRRRAVDRLRYSELRYRTMLQTANDAIVTADEDGRISVFNMAAEKMFGWPADEVLGREVEILMPERYRRHHRESFRRAIETRESRVAGTVREYEALRKDGAEFPVSITMTPIEIEGRFAFIAIIRDVTERRKAELEMKKLLSVIEQSVNVVFITDKNGVIEYVNPMFEKVTGYSKEEALGGNPRILASGETAKEEYDELWSTILAGKTWRGVFKNRKKDGGCYWSNGVITPIQDDRGEITHFFSVSEDITEKKAYEDKILHITSYDETTGLLNRSRFISELNIWLSYLGSSGRPGALLILDIDQFRFFNDTHGHAMGDEVLASIARALQTSIEGVDSRHAQKTDGKSLLGRLSSDEFVVFLPFLHEADAVAVAEEFRKTTENLHPPGNVGRVTGSIGVAIFPGHGRTTKELLARADAAVYRAKDLGRNRVHLFRPEDRDLENMHIRLVWKERIVNALENDRFLPWFQPIIHLKDKRIHHYEALARMKDADGSVLSPGVFIDIAERFGIIGLIDRAIIGKVLKLQAGLGRQGRLLNFSMNLSGKDIGDSELISFLKEKIAETGALPECLIFEITESAAIHDLDRAVRFIKELRSIGCRFSLDDFGVGFTSFAYLKEMDVDYIKIDGSFIKNLRENHKDQLFVKAMADVATGMGIKTIAEFVEDSETLSLLEGYGVDYAQGYLIGKPAPDI